MRSRFAMAPAVFVSLGAAFAADPVPPVVPTLGPKDSYQINYLANIHLGGSYVNITNAGSNASGPTGLTICANVYIFAPDQFMVSCCSCPVTANSLVSLRGSDIGGGGGPVPTSVTVKLIAALPSRQPICNAKSAPNPAGGLASGMRAWATRLHSSPGGTFGTETKFSPAPLSQFELDRLTFLCSLVPPISMCNCSAGAL